MQAFDPSIVESVEMRLIRPSGFPVRHGAEDAASAGLKSSIRDHGLLQPIVVRPSGGGFEIVAGHRRFRACRCLRWRSVPCRIRELDDRQAYEAQLAENLQRRSMDPLEEAEAYQRYVHDFGWGGAADLARRIGKSPEYVSHRMQLLRLSEDVKEKVASRRLSVSQAIEVVGLGPDAGGVVDEIIDNGLTVRQIRGMRRPPRRGADAGSREEAIVRQSTLALRVALSRVDGLIGDAHKVPAPRRAALVEHLMGQRREIHSMIDGAIRYKRGRPA